jgi:hypothetical protein
MLLQPCGSFFVCTYLDYERCMANILLLEAFAILKTSVYASLSNNYNYSIFVRVHMFFNVINFD